MNGVIEHEHDVSDSYDFVMALPPELIAARDSVLYSNDTTVIPTTYGEYSPLFPNPVICVKEVISTGCLVVYRNLIPWNGVGQWLSDTWTWHYLATYISFIDVFHIILSALIFTALRFVLYKMLLERIPKWYGLAPDETEKFPEAAFRTMAYAVLWILSCISVFKTNVFFRPISSWIDWTPGTPIPTDIYWIYILQLGFYIHLIYATTYIETVRKDYFVQMLHHVLTLGLLGYSFMIRLHLIGLYVLFIHDIADIFLEFAKTCIYFKTMNGITYKLPEYLANIFFGMFVLQWILFRLYWYPVKLLYTTSHVTFHFFSEAPFYLLPNFMLWILYGLHVYWFKFILKVVIKVIVGEELADNRDYEDKEK